MNLFRFYETIKSLSNPFYIRNTVDYQVVCKGEIVTGFQVDRKNKQIILKTYISKGEANE